MGRQPKCNTCQRHHSGRCGPKICEACGKVGHLKDNCWTSAGRGGQGGFGNRNNNRSGNGNRAQGNNGGNGNRGNDVNQAGNAN